MRVELVWIITHKVCCNTTSYKHNTEIFESLKFIVSKLIRILSYIYLKFNNLNKENMMIFDSRRLLLPLVSISILLSHSVTAQGEIQL